MRRVLLFLLLSGLASAGTDWETFVIEGARQVEGAASSA
jgi:hypothetical protein